MADNNDNIAYLIKYHPTKIFEPGEKYEYSNTGYMLLASIAEKTSGKDFIDLCRERIFEKLKMVTADIRSKQQKFQFPAMAWGHIYVREKQRYIEADSFPEFNYAIWLGNRKGPGRISATSTDLFKWSDALYHHSLINEEAMSQAYHPARLNNGSFSNYGFGWEIRNDKGGKIVSHAGDNPGYKTIMHAILTSTTLLSYSAIMRMKNLMMSFIQSKVKY